MFRTGWLVVWGLVLCSVPASAQEAINYASVSGRVTDVQGAAIAGVVVTARQLETNVTADTTTDTTGRFRFQYLRVGPYEIVAQQPGFAPTSRRLTLTLGAAFDLPFVLELEGVVAEVTVTAETSVLEAARTQIAATVSPTEMAHLPLNGRNFLDIALLAPAVAPPNINSTQLFAETSAVPGVGLSVGTQRNFSNSFIVDGLSANDDAAGLSGVPYGVDAVEQVQIVTSGGHAELGRALGGYVNVVTRSGTNTLRGSAYGYFRDDALNASNALSGTTLPMSQQQYGASLGGPVVANRTFYFANYERRRLAQTGLVTISEASAAVINARLEAVGYQGSPVVTGIYDNPVNSTHLIGKVDHSVSGRDQLSVRYSLYDVSATNARGAGGLSAPSASSNLDNLDQAIAFGNTISVGTRTVNETRVQYTNSDLLAPPSDPVGPAVSIAGVATFGTLSSSPTGRLNRMVQAVNTLSQHRGDHALRAGVDVIYNGDTITFPRAVRGSYAFSSLANFLAGRYNNAGFTQTFGDQVVEQGNANLGLFVQDEWRAGPGVTLNLGLRYDLQWLDTIRTDADNVSPRAGFAWAPGTSGALVVRGSAGLFFDRVPLRALANALLSAGNTTDVTALRQAAIVLSPAQAGSPVFPAILDAPVPAVTLPNLQTMDPEMQNAYSQQASLEAERQVGRLGTVSVGYSYVRGRRLIISINQNVPSCPAVGTNNGCRPEPSYANNNQYSPEADSTYHGLLVSFVQRPSRWGYVRASYTLSRAMNNVGEFFFSSPIDPFDLMEDWGRADNDRRHMFSMTAMLQASSEPATNAWQRLSHGFQLSTMAQAYSAAPFNITSGVTTVQGTAGRPIVDGEFIPRNSGVGDTFFSLSLRLSRTFTTGTNVQIEALAEVFNVTNTVNEITRNTTFGTGEYPTNPSPTFNQVTAVGDPRSWQFGLRLRF